MEGNRARKVSSPVKTSRGDPSDVWEIGGLIMFETDSQAVQFKLFQ